MLTALFLSPHLDDAAFSCGGLIAQLGDAGWRTVMATAFTATVLPATGFALACQTDKGLGPEVDYMALRRAEDWVAADILGVSDLRWLGLPEAPHRGYNTASALFGAVSDDDDVWRPLAGQISALANELRPDLILAPQGLGNHVDHRQMIRAVMNVAPQHLAFYRDTPYAIRNPDAAPHVGRPDLRECALGIADGLERRIAASCGYASQVGFQFGGPAPLAAALREFALREGQGRPAERFLAAGDCAMDLLPGGHRAAIL